MRNAFTLLTLFVVAGCATSKPRTKWTDRVARVLIDPDSVSAEHHVAIQRALFESGRFFVVDRSKGYKAVKVEQERQHREESDRFADREKWSHWGKLYGVGGIVVAHAECKNDQGMIFGGWYSRCRQYLSVVDANTGEIIAAVQGMAESPETDMVPSWDETVDKLVAAYPTKFESKTSHELEAYRDLSSEEAQRAREARREAK